MFLSNPLFLQNSGYTGALSSAIFTNLKQRKVLFSLVGLLSCGFSSSICESEVFSFLNLTFRKQLLLFKSAAEVFCCCWCLRDLEWCPLNCCIPLLQPYAFTVTLIANTHIKSLLCRHCKCWMPPRPSQHIHTPHSKRLSLHYCMLWRSELRHQCLLFFKHSRWYQLSFQLVLL